MDSLPREIWTKIFHHIPLYKDLIQCQLVCKQWRYPAETAMFTCKDVIDIRSEERLIKLCNHLEKDPSRGNLITSMLVSFRNDHSSVHVERLVRLAFNPNMYRLFGTAFDNDRIYQLMDSIVKGSNVKFTKLAIIPLPNKATIQWHYRFLLNFTESITALDLIFMDSSNFSYNVFINEHLHKFVKLNCLTIDAAPDLTVQRLDVILSKCPSITTINMKIAAGIAPLPTFHQIDTWTEASVEPSRHMKQLFLDKYVLYRPDLVEYLVRKYPYTKGFSFGSCVIEFRQGDLSALEEDEDQNEILWLTNNLYRSLAALKELDEFEVQIKLPPGVYLDDIVNRMQTQDNFIVIDYYFHTERLLQARSKPRHLIKLPE